MTNLFLRPKRQAFSTEVIVAHLETLPDAFIDPVGTGLYLICGREDAVPLFRQERISDPSQFPYACLVEVTPSLVSVIQEYGDEDRLRSAREFVRWMMAHFECIIEDEYQNDLTQKCESGGVESIYPNRLT